MVYYTISGGLLVLFVYRLKGALLSRGAFVFGEKELYASAAVADLRCCHLTHKGPAMQMEE